ncbi:semaphorin-4A-like [Pyxicephalus adspersus]|uniref:semaphorin-4A-like n=1 Tax=Pyxicephalus adspersus TaxID=30357 RepID=UPI003B5CD3E4
MPPWVIPHWLALLFVTVVPLSSGEFLPRIVFHYGDPARSVSSFHRDGVQNYDQLLLVEDKETLYVGARENLLELSIQESGNVQLLREVSWPSTLEQITSCRNKARKEAECYNFVRILQPVNDTHLYVCGTNAFNPNCTYVVSGSGDRPINPFKSQGPGGSIPIQCRICLIAGPE